MSGCIHGATYQKKPGKPKELAKDSAGKPILLLKCGKLCDTGQKLCPRHLAMESVKK